MCYRSMQDAKVEMWDAERMCKIIIAYTQTHTLLYWSIIQDISKVSVHSIKVPFYGTVGYMSSLWLS